MRRKSGISGWRLGAPVVTVALLVAMLVIGGVQVVSSEQTESYHRKVRELVDQIPYRVGPWVGTDVEAPPAAVKLLKPNALLQRRFVNPMTGEAFSLLVVHCGDVRDMQGHYPPVCYPAHGWELTTSRQTAIEIGVGSVPAREYDFRRISDGFVQKMNVIGFFIVPQGDAEIVSSYEALEASARRRSQTGMGAAQIQFVTEGDMNPAQRKKLADEFILPIEPLIRAIAEGVQGG